MVNALKKAKSRKEGFREGEFNTLVRDDLAGGGGGASKGGLGGGLQWGVEDQQGFHVALVLAGAERVGSGRERAQG